LNVEELGGKSLSEKRDRIKGDRFNKIGLVCIVLIVISLLIGGFVVLFFFTGKVDIRTKSMAGNFEGFRGYSNLEIFPKEELNQDSIAKYSYFCMDSFMDPTCKIYMECDYTDQEFEKEITRLKNITATLDGVTNSIIYNEDYFDYPAYISMFNWSSCYEYALILEEEKKIVYVFVQGGSQIPPSKYRVNKEHKEAESFSLYSVRGHFVLKYR